jgi:hypothetical protein
VIPAPYSYGRDTAHTGRTLPAMTPTPQSTTTAAFLGLGVLYVTTSAFTLAKTIRDRQEITTVVGRVDQARVDKLLAEHDPYAVR